MKRFSLIVLVIMVSMTLQAQTAIIAHKSHSGAPENYHFGPGGNFGEPPPMLREVEKINDTTVVMTHDQLGYVSKDTIYNHPLFSNPNIPVDSLRKMYYGEVKFKNFSKKPIDDESQNALPYVEKRDSAQQPTKAQSGKKAKRASKGKQKKIWIWLLVIGGGTFLGTGMLQVAAKRRKRQVRYA